MIFKSPQDTMDAIAVAMHALRDSRYGQATALDMLVFSATMLGITAAAFPEPRKEIEEITALAVNIAEDLAALRDSPVGAPIREI